MNETTEAAAYETRAKLSSASYDRVCFNADFGYYIANVTLANCKDSYGPGCFVDQLCAVGLSSACGFGHVFNPSNEEEAHSSLLKYNVVINPPFQDLQKHMYSGDVGITVCTYPNGKLGDGMNYENIVSTGFTSPNIAGMLLERNVDGARTMATNIRNRHSGTNTSPWNEPECDLLYSRSMAHWNIFAQACGCQYGATSGALSFDPRMNQNQFQIEFYNKVRRLF